MPMPRPDASIEEWIKYFEEAFGGEDAVTVSGENLGRIWPIFRERYARAIEEQMIREELLKKAAIAQANKVWWIRFFWGLFILILIIIACILVVRWEINTPVNNPSQQGILCTGGAEHTMNFTDTIGAFGCRRSMNQAFEAATDACKNLQNSCTGTCTNGETCQSVPSIVSTDQSWGVVSCITDITYQCPCKCI